MSCYRSCSWCHELVSMEALPAICPTCHHRADLPRALCDCPQCKTVVIEPPIEPAQSPLVSGQWFPDSF